MPESAPPPVSRHARSDWAELCDALPDGVRCAHVDDDTAWDWTLVLKSARIPHRTAHGPNGWRILVPESRLGAALEQITAFEAENPPGEDAAPAPLPVAPGLEAQGVAGVMGLAAVFEALITSPLPSLGLYPEDWKLAGAANARLILDGEWWRTVTALTLHADPAHFLGNAVIGGVFMACLCRTAGSGAAWLLFVLSGVAGNLLNAWFRVGGHISIGASTAVFGVVGALGALAMVREGRLDFRRAAAPVVAGLALLGMLGTGGERTDLGAHLFGFAAGLPLGAAWGRRIMLSGLPGPRAQWGLGGIALGLVILAWLAAFAA